jgi:hypothetical protein
VKPELQPDSTTAPSRDGCAASSVRTSLCRLCYSDLASANFQHTDLRQGPSSGELPTHGSTTKFQQRRLHGCPGRGRGVG